MKHEVQNKTIPVCLAIPFVSRIYPQLLDQLLLLSFDYFRSYVEIPAEENHEFFDELFTIVFDDVHLEVSTSSLNVIASKTIEAQLYSETFYTTVLEIVSEMMHALHALGPFFAGIDLRQPLLQQQPYIFFHAKQYKYQNNLYVRK